MNHVVTQLEGPLWVTGPSKSGQKTKLPPEPENYDATLPPGGEMRNYKNVNNTVQLSSCIVSGTEDALWSTAEILETVQISYTFSIAKAMCLRLHF